MVSPTQALLLIAASAAAGAINSVAGGGTLLTFPTLVAAGIAEKIANATNTVALWPGQLSSLWGYRKELGQEARSVGPLLAIGLAGGIAGALLLLATPAAAFKAAAPFLVLTATVLFLVQDRVSRWLKARAAAMETETEGIACPAGANVPLDHVAASPQGQAVPEAVGMSLRSEATISVADSLGESATEIVASQPGTPLASLTPPQEVQTRSNGTLAPAGQAIPSVAPLRLSPGVAIFLFGIAVYGGYFGAGIGILTLAALGLIGLTNLHQMNGIKNIFTLGINGIAAAVFMAKGIVNWPLVGVMVVGSLFGGYAGAGIAKRVGQKNTRRAVIAIGFVSAGWLLVQLALGKH